MDRKYHCRWWCIGFLVYNTVTYSQQQISYPINISSYSGSCFIDSTTFIWADNTGIFITNIQTKQVSKLKGTCDSKTYLSPSYSSSSNKVIWNKVIPKPVNSTTLHVSSIIVMMNPDGTDEQEINIP